MYRLLLLLLCSSVLAPLGMAQDAAPAEAASPLGIRQQRIERMTGVLEQKLKQLTLALQAAEPRQAQRLQEALNRAKELLIQKRMADVRHFLDQAQLDAAADGQQSILTDIQSLISLLLAEDSGQDRTAEEAERLAVLQQQVQKLLDSQREVKRESDVLTATRPDDSQIDSLAKRQEELAGQAKSLAQPIAGSEATPASPSPGSDNLAAAQASMQAASSSLRNKEPGAAGPKQQDAIHNLLAALDAIKERQKELDAARATENLAQLAALFQQMLTVQRRLSIQTADLDAKRSASGGQLARADRNAVRSIGDQERRLEPIPAGSETMEPGLAGKAQQALDRLSGAGASIALPEIVGQLRDDLITVGNLLADDLKTGAATTDLQADIELTLATLSDVLQSTSKQSASGNSSAADSGGKSNASPRLPASVELQLLQAAQRQLNRRTAAFDQTRAAPEALTEALAAEAAALAARQGKLAEMTAEISTGRP